MVLVGEWKFKASANELIRGDERIKLEPQCVLVLQYLCEHAGEVVSRDELLDAVWGREAVSLQSVPVVISKLRTLLGDNKRQPAYIETVTKRGYRLIAPVKAFNESLSKINLPLSRKFSAMHAGLLLSAVAGLCIVLAVVLLKAPTPSPRVIYVADVANLTTDARFNVVAAGASEILSTELARTKNLSVKRLRRNPTDNQWVNPDLRESDFAAGPLLTASLVPTDNSKSIVMQLVDGKDRQVVWTHSFNVNDTAFAAGQRQAANALFEHLGVRQDVDLAASYIGSPGVEEMYWRAKFFWGLRGRQNNIMAADLALQALEIDPNYVPAHALIAQIFAKYSAEYLDIGPADTQNLAREHFEFAVHADPLHPATLTAQTRLVTLFDRRPDLALEAANKAIQLGLNDGMIHMQRAASLYLLGRTDEALASIDKAMEVEYGSPYVRVQYILANYLGGRFQNVIDVAEEMEPEYYDDFRAQVAASYYEIGAHEKAMQAWFGALNSAGVDVGIKEELLALVADGNVSDAYEMMSTHVDSVSNADNLQTQQFQLYWAFYYGDDQLPLEKLKSIPASRHARFLLWLHRWPLFERYKGEPEFQEYLRGIGVASFSHCVHEACAGS